MTLPQKASQKDIRKDNQRDTQQKLDIKHDTWRAVKPSADQNPN